ncbi:MAG: phosphoribosyltransferase family protein [Saprospiraceae bacterium]
MELLNSLLWDLKNVMFPDICPGCEENILPKSRLLCTECLMQLPFTDHFDIAENKVAAHFYGRLPLRSAAGLLYFQEGGFVQDILHSFKYKGNKNVGRVMGQLAGEKLLLSAHFRHIDVIIPVPLHPDKEYVRGYNQSLVFAEGISTVTKIPTLAKVLTKPKKNESQTGKNRVARVKNVSETYALNSMDYIRGKHVLLVDDVVTTGATLEACGLLLCQASPASISVLTIACAV